MWVYLSFCNVFFNSLTLIHCCFSFLQLEKMRAATRYLSCACQRIN
jgi:hypothetical protein